ncbi:MAG: hypothetical protein FJ202_12115 [Gemmatimonadetes bacterium]|nr:hypothetical protein [Gemmatimonadota bacterium]
MAGLPTTQRDQLLFAIGFLALIGAGAYWYFVDSPKGLELAAKQAHVDSLNASNQKARAQLARGNVATIRAEADSMRENLLVMRSLVPSANEVPALVDQVSNAARRVKLDLAAIEPQPVIEGEMFDAHRYRLKLNGTFHEVAQVLTYIGTLNRIVAPMNLSLALPSGTVKAEPGKQVLSAAFDIQTYVVRTAPKAAN